MKHFFSWCNITTGVEAVVQHEGFLLVLLFRFPHLMENFCNEYKSKKKYSCMQLWLSIQAGNNNQAR